jgi:hypothetical protein
MQNNFSKCREWVPRGTSQHKWRWLTTLLLILTLAIGNVWAAAGDAEIVSLTSGNITAANAKAYAVTADNDVLADAAIYATSRNANSASAKGIEPNYMGFLFKPVVNCKVVLKGVNTTTSDRNFNNKVFEVTNTDMYPIVKASSSYNGSISKYLLNNYTLYTTKTQSEWKDLKMIKYGSNKYQEDATNAAKTVTGESAQSALYTQISTINVISITKKASSGDDDVVEDKTFSTSEGEYIFQAGKTYAIYLHRNSSGLYVKELSFVPVYQLTWALDGGSITSAADAYTNAGYYAKGTELTAPTVAKAGADFTGWSPAVAATMPAAATTYTATWATACSAGVPGNVTKGALTAGEITLTAEGSAASGDTWYWQTSESGVDKTNAGSSFVATSAGTYYVRSYNTAADCWNVTAKSIELTAEDFLAHYAITYKKGEYGTGEIAGGEKVEGVAYTLSSERFTRAGYVQTGWSLTDGGAKAYDLGGSYTTDEAKEFFPVWTETSTYVASFNSGEGCSASTPAGWTFANAGSYGASVATADYECKFGENFPTSAAEVVKNASYIAFAKADGACATYDLGAATTVSALAGTFYVGSGSDRTFTIEYLAADATTVLHTISTTTNTNWGEKAVNDATVVPNVKYIRINPAHAGSSYSWLVMKAFSVTYVDLVTKYNVSFDKNGGSGDDMATLKYAEGAEVTLPACTFIAPDNKEFDAWTSTDVTISNNKFTMPNKAVTIKATWKFLPKLTLTAGEGATGDDVVAYYAAGTQISVPEKPAGFSNGTKDFTGWVYSQAVTIEADKFAMPSTDLTLTAQWASATAVAQILGGDSYETLEAALAAVAGGQTIQMLQDYEFDLATTIVISGKAITLDLNGKNITLNGTKTSGGLIRVSTGATLNLIDNTVAADATIDGEHNITYAGGKFLFNNNGNDTQLFTLEEGCEMNINSGWYESNGRLIAIFDPNTTLNVTSDKAVLIATNSNVISGNGTAAYKDYVINISNGILLSKSTGGGDGTVIYHPNEGNLNISGGTLIAENGPAVVVRGGNTNVTGGIIEANGTGTYIVGDSQVEVPADGIVWDFKAAYPGQSSIAATVSAGTISSVSAVYADAEPTATEEAAIAVSGGTFKESVAEPLCAENYAPKDNGDGTYGVKPLAQSIDLATYAQSHTGTAWQGYLTDNGYAYVVGSESKAEISLDNSNAFDRGLKLKQSTTSNISFEVAAGKLITIVTGKVNGLSIAINGAAATAIAGGTDAEHLATSYYYNAAAQNVVITETNTGYNIIREIKIENPYEVSFNTHGADAIAAATFTGTEITLPTPTNGTGSFKGWYDAAEGGTLIGAANAGYTPTADITLHAQWETVSTVNTLSDLQVDGATIDGFDPATNIYYLVYEYGQQPEITSATATAGDLATVTINNEPVDEGTYKYVQVKVVPESGDNDKKFYQVRYTNRPKKGVELIKVMIPNGTGNAQEISEANITGYIGGTANQKLESGKHKLGSGGHYIGITLAEGTFLENDLVNVNIETVTGDKLRVFSENTAAEAKVVAQSAANMVAGVNTVTLGATTTNSLYLRRGTDDENYQKGWNPFVGYISVERYMNPFIESFKIGTVSGTIDEEHKTIAIELPYNTDLTGVAATVEAYANGSATVDAPTELAYNTPLVYTVSSAYAEDTPVEYTITITEAVAIKEVVISGTLSVLENETTALSAVVYDTNDEVASIQDVTWSVKAGDESLAEVSAEGVVTGKAIGTAHIIATSVADNTKSAQVEVVISENPCRVWNAPATSWSDAIVTIGKFQIKRGECPASSSVTPYSGASSVYGIKVDGSAKFIELTMSDGSQFESLTLGVASGSNGSSPKYALVASSAVTFNTSSVLSVAEYTANAKDAAQALNDIVLPEGTRNVRIYRMYEGKGEGTSVYLYYANACKKELVPLTSISVADLSLAVGVAGTPVVTLNPTTADVASYVWSIESDETGVATIDPATGVLSSTATGAVTVKVTATDAFSNVRESNVATINIVNKYVDVVPVSETTTWSWSGKATTDVIITGVDTVLANYFSGAEWQKIAGKAANDQYAYRSSSYDCYQGTYLYLNATVPGMLVINARYASSGAKLSVNGHEIATLTDQYTEYKVAVPAGNVKIEATGNQKMRIKTMKFDADFSSYELMDNALNGYTRPVTEGRYGTICLPNGGVMTGAMLFDLAYFDPDQKKIFFDEVINGTMEAGTPYIFLPNEGVDALKVFYTDAAGAVAGNANGLFGSYTQETVTPNDGNYILLNNQYCFVNSTAYVGANRAYIKLYGDGHALTASSTSAPQPAPGRRRVSMGVQGEQVATGIEGLNVGDQPIKVVIDGQMYILRGDKMYDATGRLVK